MTSDLEIEAFICAFEECRLPRPEWTHQKHLLMALWYLVHFPREEATARIRAGLLRYNRHNGREGRYHETVTLAWAAVIANFLATQDRSQPVSDMLARLVDACGERDYLLRFYSRERLESEEARLRWVAPDLGPLPGTET